jgi:hypothetical protein
MTKSGDKMNPMGSDLENFSYSLGSSGVRLYREKMFLGKMQSVFHHEDKA